MMKRTGLLVIFLLAAISCHSQQPHHPPVTQPIASKPALELKKSIVFPLATKELPTNAEDLRSAITAALSQRIHLWPQTPPVQITEASYPHLKEFLIDLSHATIDTDTKTPKPKPQPLAPLKRGLLADNFTFRADPILIDGASMSLIINATNVRLDVAHDKDHHPMLVLARASSGTVTCQTTSEDLAKIFKSSANEKGKRVGLTVQSARVNLKSDSDHDLSADLHLASHLLLLPVGLHFTANVTVDDTGLAHLSHLTCTGDDLAGSLITTIIRPALTKYDNKTMPLIAFPTNDLRLSQVRLHLTNQSIQIRAAFSS